MLGVVCGCCLCSAALCLLILQSPCLHVCLHYVADDLRFWDIIKPSLHYVTIVLGMEPKTFKNCAIDSTHTMINFALSVDPGFSFPLSLINNIVIINIQLQIYLLCLIKKFLRSLKVGIRRSRETCGAKQLHGPFFQNLPGPLNLNESEEKPLLFGDNEKTM